MAIFQKLSNQYAYAYAKAEVRWSLLRSKYELASDLILWQPQNGNRSRGRPAKTYIDQLRDDTDLLTIAEIKTAMNDREGLKKYDMDYRASST